VKQPDHLTGETIRAMESESIRRWVQGAADKGALTGRVLDYGCGRQPYRTIVEASGGFYYPFDRADFPGSTVDKNVGGHWAGKFQSILCTQVIQYVANPGAFIRKLERKLDVGGALVITWPSAWVEIEMDDKWRFTQAGMSRLFAAAGFDRFQIESRGTLEFPDFRLPLGHGAIAWR
jgi:SAM-dependent methyltransferase